MNKQDGFIEHIVSFTEEEVSQFIKEHSNERFYAFAYDVNPATKGIYLSFNTEADFKVKLKQYQEGNYAFLYQSDDQIKRLRYNPGDWKYQNFVSIEFIYDAKIKELFDVVLVESKNNLLDYAEQALLSFKKTETYEHIPKEKDFIAFCIDHEEDELEALDRALRIH